MLISEEERTVGIFIHHARYACACISTWYIEYVQLNEDYPTISGLLWDNFILCNTLYIGCILLNILLYVLNMNPTQTTHSNCDPDMQLDIKGTSNTMMGYSLLQSMCFDSGEDTMKVSFQMRFNHRTIKLYLKDTISGLRWVEIMIYKTMRYLYPNVSFR